MKRRLLDILTALSLLLCVAVTAVAVRGQFVSRGSTFGPQNSRVTWRFSWRDGYLSTWFGRGYVTYYSIPGEQHNLAGLIYARGSSFDGIPIVILAMQQSQVWVLLLVTGAVPAMYLRRRLRERRRRLPGGCPTCGYDLRATPDRCPECGTAAQVVHG
jgi:hypothetical protein